MLQKTYVYRESTRRTQTLSILLMHCSRRTTPQFRCVVPSKQRCGSLMGRGGRASVEHPLAAGHLQILSVSATKREELQTFHLVHFVQHLVKSNYKLVSTGNTYSA